MTTPVEDLKKLFDDVGIDDDHSRIAIEWFEEVQGLEGDDLELLFDEMGEKTPKIERMKKLQIIKSILFDFFQYHQVTK